MRERVGDLVEILNGVDYEVWNPATDRHLPVPFGPGDVSGKRLCKSHLQRELDLAPTPDVPLIVWISRITLYALRYGTLPIVRSVGGLADTIVNATDETVHADTATGFAFDEASAPAMLDCIDRALAIHAQLVVRRKMLQRAMTRRLQLGRLGATLSGPLPRACPGGRSCCSRARNGATGRELETAQSVAAHMASQTLSTEPTMAPLQVRCM